MIHHPRGTKIERADSNKSARLPSPEVVALEIKESLAETWLPRIYSDRILTIRTRAHHLPPSSKGETVEVQHTLLGVELKVGRRRMLCPDLATACYLAVFARAGCVAVAVPYDIRQTTSLAEAVELSWQRMLLLIDSFSKKGEPATSTFRSRVRRTVLHKVRSEIERAGAGTPVPEFNQNTKQHMRRAAGQVLPLASQNDARS